MQDCDVKVNRVGHICNLHVLAESRSSAHFDLLNTTVNQADEPFRCVPPLQSNPWLSTARIIESTGLNRNQASR